MTRFCRAAARAACRVLRPLSMLGALAAIAPHAFVNPAAAQPHYPQVPALLREIAVTDDLVDLLIVAEGFDLMYRHEASVLRDFVERRLWLQALGEPQPAVATVGEALDARWPEHIAALRQRGRARVIDAELVRTQRRPLPPERGSLRQPALELLLADLRVTNTGALPIAALRIGIRQQVEGGTVVSRECVEHGSTPIGPGDARVISCAWRGAVSGLQELAATLAAHDRSTPTMTAEHVSFAAAGRRVPYDVGYSSETDLELRREAIARLGLARCGEGGACPAGGSSIAFALLPWIVVPILLGCLWGRSRFT